MRPYFPYAFIAALLLIPPWLSITQGPPHVHSGDEPHYLIQLNSLLQDGDLEISNNYASAGRGSYQAGKSNKNFPLDHHSAWYVGGRHYYWSDIYFTDSGSFFRSSSGDWLPRYRPGIPLELLKSILTSREYSQHPFGLALLQYLLLKPIMLASSYPPEDPAYSDLVEKLAAGLSPFLGFLTALSLLSILRSLRPQKEWENWIPWLAAAAIFGTPLWHYSRTLFSEIYLSCFGAFAMALWLRGKRPLWISLPLAAGALLKPPFLLLAIPLAIDLEGPLKARAQKLSELFAVPAIACALICWMNQRMFGNFLTGAQPFRMGKFLGGLHGIFLSSDHGIAWYAPLLLLALAGWIPLLRSNLPPQLKRKAFGILIGGTLYLLMIAFWFRWDGGWCYGTRLVLPAFPLLLAGLAGLSWPRSHWAKKTGLLFLAVLSVAINLGPGLFPDSYWGVNPLFKWLSSVGFHIH